MKFYYSDDGEHMLVQPADGRFYPFLEQPHSNFTEQEFVKLPYGGYDTYAEAQLEAIAGGEYTYPDNPRIEIYSGETQ